jgi:hypothetical protein
MGKKLKKAKEYVKEHKKIFLIGGGILLTAAGVVILKKKMPKVDYLLDPKKIGEGCYECLINDGVVNVQKWSDGSHDVWIDDNLALMRDLKSIGDDLCEFIPGITPDSRISMMLMVSNEKGIKKT